MPPKCPSYVDSKQNECLFLSLAAVATTNSISPKYIGLDVLVYCGQKQNKTSRLSLQKKKIRSQCGGVIPPPYNCWNGIFWHIAFRDNK